MRHRERDPRDAVERLVNAQPRCDVDRVHTMALTRFFDARKIAAQLRENCRGRHLSAGRHANAQKLLRGLPLRPSWVERLVRSAVAKLVTERERTEGADIEHHIACIIEGVGQMHRKERPIDRDRAKRSLRITRHQVDHPARSILGAHRIEHRLATKLHREKPCEVHIQCVAHKHVPLRCDHKVMREEQTRNARLTRAHALPISIELAEGEARVAAHLQCERDKALRLAVDTHMGQHRARGQCTAERLLPLCLQALRIERVGRPALPTREKHSCPRHDRGVGDVAIAWRAHVLKRAVGRVRSKPAMHNFAGTRLVDVGARSHKARTQTRLACTAQSKRADVAVAIKGVHEAPSDREPSGAIEKVPTSDKRARNRALDFKARDVEIARMRRECIVPSALQTLSLIHRVLHRAIVRRQRSRVHR